MKSVSIFFKFINPCFLSYLLYHICLLLCLSGYFTVSLDLVPWVPEVFSRVRRGASSAAGRRHERDRNRKPRMESLWHIEYRFTDRAGGGNVALSWLMRYPPPTHHSFRHEESLSFKMFYSYFCKFLFVLFTFLNFRCAS